MCLTIAVYVNYDCYHKSCAEPGKMTCDCLDWKKIIVTDILGNTQKHLWFYTLSGYLGKQSTAGTTLLTATCPNTSERNRFSRKTSLHLQICWRELFLLCCLLWFLSFCSFISMNLFQEESVVKNQCVFAWLSVDFECMVIRCQRKMIAYFQSCSS